MQIPLKYVVLKATLLAAALTYLAVDMWAWHGPLWRAANAFWNEPRDTSHLAAEVGGVGISKAELARYEAEQDLLAGRRAPEAARRPLYLMEMVRHTLLRTRTRYNDKNLPARREEAEAEVARLASRYPDAATFEQALASQGYTRETFTDKTEARLRELAQLERALAPLIEPSEKELADAYEDVKEELRLPARREVKHIFLATLNRDAEAVRARAGQLLERLNAGEVDFATLAREESEDERSAARGGELGLLADDSRRPLPELPLFGEAAIPAGVPTLAQSSWGWHILLAGETQPSRLPTFDECRESLLTALRSARREAAQRDYANSDIRENRKRILIYTP